MADASEAKAKRASDFLFPQWGPAQLDEAWATASVKVKAQIRDDAVNTAARTTAADLRRRAGVDKKTAEAVVGIYSDYVTVTQPPGLQAVTRGLWREQARF